MGYKYLLTKIPCLLSPILCSFLRVGCKLDPRLLSRLTCQNCQLTPIFKRIQCAINSGELSGVVLNAMK